MRNVIAHGYDALSPDRVVEAIELRVEPLRDEAKACLGSNVTFLQHTGMGYLRGFGTTDTNDPLIFALRLG